MGCIFSTEKLNTADGDNVFHCTLQLPPPSANISRIYDGYLELDSHYLKFYTKSRQEQPTMQWALQHLRRYGREGNVFHFEAGRRCEYGEGIYSFRCQNTEELYRLFEQHIYAAMEQRRLHLHDASAAQSIASRLSHYIEPKPLSGGSSFGNLQDTTRHNHGFDSIDSLPNLSLNNDGGFELEAQNNDCGLSLNGLLEHADTCTARCRHSAVIMAGMTRHTIGKCSFLDQPQRKTSISNPDCTALHKCAHSRVELLADNVHCYQNVTAAAALHCDNCAQLGAAVAIEGGAQNCHNPGAVNYIVLDLHPPRSPAQYSTKSTDIYGGGGGNYFTAAEQQQAGASMTAPLASTAASQQHKEPASKTQLGYTTIDFVKTYALIKSMTTNSNDFCVRQQHNEDLRCSGGNAAARHAHCVRKSHSISE